MNNNVRVFDKTRCRLGEGAFWHPSRQQFFWFDILNNMLYAHLNERLQKWEFDCHVSAAAWLDHERLLISSEYGLAVLDLISDKREDIIAIEAFNPLTRSNDGRADPFGGFWVSTMGKNAEKEAGAIYRYYQGELRQLFDKITIPNSICFSPDGYVAYFADTIKKTIWYQVLDQTHGWPKGTPDVFLDLRKEGLNPDGSVVDAQGNLWNAQWGAARVAQYDREGTFISQIKFPASQISCPAFAQTTLLATSAAEGTGDKDAHAGQTFLCENIAQGQAEHQVFL